MARPEAPTLLLTKLHPPVVPAQTVARERLLARLRDGRGCRLTLVACPAGFGKSTLLAAWREAGSGERPVAWVTLDEGDNDAVVLWSHVLEALGRVCPDSRRRTCVAIVPAAPLLEVVLPRLVNELVEQGEDVVLVLDDFHRVSGESARESVAWFVDHLPASFQLVLASRMDPALPLGALRAHGELLELRADELRFTDAEAASSSTGGSAWRSTRPTSRCSSRARRDGPPASTSRRSRSTASRTSTRLSARSTARARTSWTSSPARCSRATSRSCRRSCCARRCSSACAAGSATRCSGSGRRRPRWSRSRARTCSSCRSTAARRWFRFHHLFAQILRLELERREPGLVPELHRRAYAWHRASGTTDEAIHHALAARMFGEAGRLITETWVHYANSGRTASVLEWLTRFPEELLDADRRLLVVKAWVVALRGARTRCGASWPRCAPSAGSTTGRCPTAWRPWSRASRC